MRRILKLLSLLLAPILFTSLLLFQVQAQAPGTGLPIKLRNRTFTPPAGLDPVLQSAAATASSGDRIHVLLQLDHIPSPAERSALAQQGIELQQYVPDNAWVASVPAGQLIGLTATSSGGITYAGPWSGSDKLSTNAQAQTFPDWATNTTGQVQVIVLLHDDVPLTTGEALVAARNGVVAGRLTFPPALTVWLEAGQVAGLAAEEAVLWVEEAPPPLSDTNDGARDALNVNIVQSAPYGLDGSGVNVFVFDGGRVDSHPAFSSRLTFVSGDTAGVSGHATHVAGTVLGDGLGGSPPGGRDLKGMAPAASLFSAGYQQYTSDPLFWGNAGDIQTDYASARNNHNIDIATNSIGSNTAANNFDCNIQGDYGTTSALLDGIVRGDNPTVGSPVMMTWANGNERGGGSPAGRCGSNFHTTAPPSCAKNPIHVGATNSDGDSMTSFSSWGPCDDGRLKPIISGPGCESGYVNGEYAINSTDLSSSYSLKCGTSMATPAVAGAVTLGIEHYRDVTGNPSARPGNALMKAWLIHTARDQGVAGPDYSYGYGQVDALKLINLISDTTTYRGDTIAAHGEVDSFSYVIPANTGQFKVSLAWDDYAASPIISNGAAALVNNLDLEVIAPNGSTTYYPFSLDPANPERAATSSGANSLDNQEQIIIDSPTPGTWTIKVKGTSVPQAAQPYALVHTHAGTLNCGTDLVTNGGFESGSTGWSRGGNANLATVVTAPAGGSDSALLIGGEAGSVGDDGYIEHGFQQITLPPNATVAKLSFAWFMSTDESSPTIPYDRFYVIAYNTDLSQALLVGDARSNAWKANVWHGNDTVDLSPLAGQTVNLLFLAINDAVEATSFYIDNVSLVTCTENEAPQAAELALAKTAAASVVSGQPLTYTLWLTNSSSVAATGVTITDTVPAHSSLSLVSLSGDASAGGTTPGSLITWNIAADLAAGQSVSRTFVVNVNSGLSGGTISNTAAAVADNAASVSSNSVNTTIIEAAQLNLSKAAPVAVSPGSPLTYTLWLTNSGGDAATGLTLTDTVPVSSSLNLASLSGDASAGGTTPGSLITWNIAGSLAGGQSLSRTFVVNVSSGLSGGTISNTAYAGAANAAATSSNTVATNLIADPAELALAKTAAASVVSGQPLTYTLWLTNSGSVAATGVTITDTVPASGTLSLAALSGDASAGGTTPGSLITWSLAADLAAGQSVSRTFVVNVNSGLSGGTINNTATATAANAVGSVSSNSVSTTIIEAAALSLTKAANDGATAGQPLAYTLSLKNVGGDAATGLVMTDTVPAHSSLQLASLSGDASAGGITPGSVITWSISGPLAAEQSLIRSFTVLVDSGLTGGSLNNTAYASAANAPAATSNSVTTTIVEAAGLGLSKTAQSGVQSGHLLTYTLSVTNLGGEVATEVVLTDTVPASTSLVLASLSGEASASGITPGSVITWDTTVSLVPNQSLRRTFAVLVNGGLSGGQIDNTAFAWALNAEAVSGSATTLIDQVIPTFTFTETKTGSALITPTLGITLTTNRPVFTWHAASDNSDLAYYTLVITGSGSSVFSQEATVSLTTTATSYTPTSALAGGSYLWTVQATDVAGNTSDFLPPQGFAIEAEAVEFKVYLPVVVKGD